MLNLSEKKISKIDGEILNYFKEIYIKNINKKRFLKFEELYQMTLEELGICEDEGKYFQLLNPWFLNIDQQQFLKELVATEFEEIIIHNDKLVTLHLKDKVTFHPINIPFHDLFLSMQVLTLRRSIDWNHSHPFASFNILISNKNCRLTTLYPSVHGESNKLKIFLRKIGHNVFPLSNFTKDEDLISFLENLVLNKNNILITGATGSGKTSILSSLLSIINPKDHVIVLEDTREINIKNSTFTYMLSAPKTEYTLEKYSAYALRMRPERIILGEMRGAEIVPFLLAMNNGHKGLMSTIHAENAKEGLERVALLFEMNISQKTLTYSEVLKLIARNVDYVLHLEHKKIKELIKVFGSDGDHISYEYIYSEKSKSWTSDNQDFAVESSLSLN